MTKKKREEERKRDLHSKTPHVTLSQDTTLEKQTNKEERKKKKHALR